MKITFLLFNGGMLSHLSADIDGGLKSLNELKAAIAKAAEHPSLATAPMTIVAEAGSAKITVSDDASVVAACSHGEVVFDVTVESTPAQHSGAATRKVRISSQREGDFFASPADGVAEIPIGRNGLLDALKLFVRSQHSDISSQSAVSLKAVVDGENVPLASDAVVANIFEAIGYDTLLNLLFETSAAVQSAVVLTISLNDFTSHKEASHAVFKYSKNADHLLTSLKNECIHELELPVDATISVAAVVDGTEQTIISDRALGELLTHIEESGGCTEANPLKIVVEITRKAKTQNLHCKSHLMDTLNTLTTEFTFSYQVDQERLLESLKEACRHALELPHTSTIDVSAIFDGEETPLSSDKYVLNALTEFLQPGQTLELNVRVTKAAVTQHVGIRCTLGNDTVEFIFAYSPEDSNVVRNLRSECGGELETTLKDEDALIYIDDQGQEAPIASDALLRNIITCALEQKSGAVNIVVRRESKGKALTRPVRCTMEGETAEFEFKFSMDQDNLLQYLHQECKAELDLMPNDNIQLTAVMDGEAVQFKNDRELRELLGQLEPNKAFELMAVEIRSNKGSQVERKIACTLGDDTAHFTFRYSADQDGLLTSLLAECRDELDLLPNESVQLTIVLDEGTLAPINTDAEVRELLGAHETVNLIATQASAATQKAAKPATITRIIQCSLGDETAEFELKIDPSQDGLLEFLLVECRDQLDLMPNEGVRLTFFRDGVEVPVAADGVLRELLGSNPSVTLAFKAELSTSGKSKTFTRPVRCTMEGETAEFEFKFSMDQDNLLQYLHQECKAELDLMPNDNIQLTAVMDGEAVQFKNDRELRELLGQLEPNKAFELMAVEIRGAAGSPMKAVQRPTVALKLEISCGEDTANVVFRFREDEPSLLDSLKNEVRGDFELNPSASISILASSKEVSIPFQLRSDDDVKSLVGKTSVKLAVTLPKTQQQINEETPLNRSAELNALFYDWQDILNTHQRVDGSDLKLVLGNWRVDGVSLKPTDPVMVSVTEFVNDEKSLDAGEEFHSFLVHLTEHMSDVEIFKFCHGCRDVIEFMVDKSPNFRLRRSLSEAFRSIAVQEHIPRPALLELIHKTNMFDVEDVDTVVQGFPESLSRSHYNDIMEQLFGGNPKDVAEFIAATNRNAEADGKGNQHVYQLRRNRLVADIRHSLDGVAAANLTQFHLLVNTPDVRELLWCVSCLAGGPQTDVEAIEWFYKSVEDETAAYNFVAHLLQFKNASISLQLLTQVCTKLSDPALDPALLQTHSIVANGLSCWALAAGRLCCHNRRELFPPVSQLQPRPPSGKKPKPPAATTEEGEEPTPRRRGYSSPFVVQQTAQIASSGATEDDFAITGLNERYEPRLKHLTNDLQITEAKPVPRPSLKELQQLQKQEAEM